MAKIDEERVKATNDAPTKLEDRVDVLLASDIGETLGTVFAGKNLVSHRGRNAGLAEPAKRGC